MTLTAALLGYLALGNTGAAAQELAYVTTDPGTLQVIDTASNQIVDTSAASLVDITISPDGTRLYGVTEVATLQVIDTGTKQVIATIAATGRLRLAPDGKTAYLAAGSLGLYVVDTAALSATLVSFTQSIADLAISPDGKLAYLVPQGPQASAQILVVDTSTNSVITTVDVPFPVKSLDSLAAIAVSPDGRLVVVAEASSGSVVVIDTQANAISGTIPDDPYPQDIAVSPDSRFAYISHAKGTISVVDLAAQSVAARVALSHTPGRLAAR